MSNFQRLKVMRRYKTVFPIKFFYYIVLIFLSTQVIASVQKILRFEVTRELKKLEIDKDLVV